jgi:magnesium transporter
MIDVLAFHGDKVESGIDPKDVSEIVGKNGTLIWLDALDPTDEELDLIRDEFSLHHLALEDARKHGQRPKLERYPTHTFVVAYSGNLAEVDIFLGPCWIITVRARGEDGQPWDPEVARTRFMRSGPEEATCGYLMYVILDALVDGYFDRSERVEDRIEELEDHVFKTDSTVGHAGVVDERTIQEELYDLRRDLLLFRRRVQPLREVVAAVLRDEVEWVDDMARTHFQDVFDHVLRAIDQLDSQRELLGNAVDAHLAIISNRMNQVMKKMTSWGAIILGSTLVAGIYGMNFKHMPELSWRYGYPWALSLMLLITVAGYYSFKKRDWL